MVGIDPLRPNLPAPSGAGLRRSSRAGHARGLPDIGPADTTEEIRSP
jgi:hypothetical protein